MSHKHVKLMMGQLNCPITATLSFSAGKLKKIKLEESSSFSLFIDGTCSQIELVIEWFEAFLSGIHLPFPLELALETSPFRTKVLEVLRYIPFGQVKSYGEVAEMIGNPKGARAVGNACNWNPFPLVIPCHRVTMSGGKLGGFAYGCDVKQGLLSFERQTIECREFGARNSRDLA